jgi:arabinosyltransferase
MYKQLWLEPYAVHTTFQYAGTEGKRHRLREAMQFFDPPSYYDTPGLSLSLSHCHVCFQIEIFICLFELTGGYMSFKPRIPKKLLLDGAHTVDSHFALVNYQVNLFSIREFSLTYHMA